MLSELNNEESKKRKIKGLTIKSFNELAEHGRTVRPFRKLFGNNILENNTVLFAAERGTGKTFLMLQLAIAVSRGDTEFLGESIETHGNVLFINMELGVNMVSQRITKLTSTTHTANQYQAIALTCRGNLDSIMPQIIETIEEYKPVLVIIDNLRSAFANKNNESNREMTQSIMEVNELKDEYGFALVLVHHTKKGTSGNLTTSDLQSGAGAISDLVDGDFFLRKSKQNKDFRILKRAKSRNCEEQEGAKLIRLNNDTLWFELEQEEVDEKDHIIHEQSTDYNKNSEKIQQTKQLKAQGKSVDDIAAQLGVDRATVYRWLKKQ